MRILCDFCSVEDSCWCYPAKDFTLTNIQQIVNLSVWTICDICASLIESGDREALLKRCLDTFILARTMGKYHAEKEIKRLHQTFFDGQVGASGRIRLFN